MSKQDRQGVRTPMQLEQKYDLSAYERNDKSYAQLESQTNQLNQTLAQFMADTNGKIAELEEENTTTFFGSGVPTLNNYPASDWTSDELKDIHIGNMYQDEDTDYTYLFKCTVGTYEWVQCKSEGGGGTPSGDISVSDITDLTVSADELNHLEGVTSNVQEQLNQFTTKLNSKPNKESQSGKSISFTVQYGESALVSLFVMGASQAELLLINSKPDGSGGKCSRLLNNTYYTISQSKNTYTVTANETIYVRIIRF